MLLLDSIDSQRDGVEVRELESLSLGLCGRHVVEIELEGCCAEGNTLKVYRLVFPDAEQCTVIDVQSNWEKSVVHIECKILSP